LLVRLAGIEPTTPWFVAKYSIQLSYSREKQKYSRGSTFLEGCLPFYSLKRRAGAVYPHGAFSPAPHPGGIFILGNDFRKKMEGDLETFRHLIKPTQCRQNVGLAAAMTLHENCTSIAAV
jgi:hypothetical protein